MKLNEIIECIVGWLLIGTIARMCIPEYTTQAFSYCKQIPWFCTQVIPASIGFVLVHLAMSPIALVLLLMWACGVFKRGKCNVKEHNDRDQIFD